MEVLAGRSPVTCVVLAGEAGIGKSRLIEVASADAARDGITVLTGWCLPMSEALPLLPVIEVLRALADLDDTHLLAAAWTGTAPWVRLEIENLLGATHDAPEEGGRDQDRWARQRMFEAVRQVLEAAARLRPMAMVVEDLHWADALTIDLLQYLRAPRRGASVPMLVSFRTSDAPDPYAAEWVSRQTRDPATRHLQLEPLSADETAEQIELVLHTAPDPSWANSVFLRTNGNPFYTAQLVSHLRVERSLEASTQETIPAGLADLIATRVAGVGSVEQHVVQTLAVAGRALSEQDLASITDRPVTTVRSAVSALQAAALMRVARPTEDHRLAHAVVGEAVYAGLLPGLRRELHRNVAARLGERPGVGLAAEVAHHLRAADDDAAELPWRIIAARHADAVHAAVDSAQHWCRAVDLVRELPARLLPDGISVPSVYARAQEALWVLGRAEQATRLAEEAADRFLPLTSDPTARAELYVLLGRAKALSDSEAGLDLFRRAERLYESAGPSPGLVNVLIYLVGRSRQAGHLDDAQRYAERGLELATSLGRRLDVVRFLGHTAWAAMVRGDAQAALALIDRQIAILEPGDPPYQRISAAIDRTDILLKLGRPAEVAAAASPGLAAAAEGMESSFVAAVLRTNMTDAAVQQGRPGDVTALIHSATSGVDADLSNHPDHAARAELDMLSGDVAAARRRWTSISALGVSSLDFRLEYARPEVELRLWSGDPAGASALAMSLLHEAAGTDESRQCGALLVLAMRSGADARDQVRGRRGSDADNRAETYVAELDAVLASMSSDPFGPDSLTRTGDADAAGWHAERTRLLGRADPERWGSAVAAWDSLGRPFKAAYARWRLAESLLADRSRKAEAGAELTLAAAQSEQHVPLHAEIVALARRARIELHPPETVTVDTAPRAGPAAPGLTPRELAVLGLVVAGRTNAEIGRELFISAKTAGVHVSNILRKLDVTTRTHAATVAVRSGLVPADGH